MKKRIGFGGSVSGYPPVSKSKMLLILCAILLSLTCGAKEKLTTDNETYRRNSLCTYFIGDHVFCLVSQDQILDTIAKFLGDYQIPDKYDDHLIGHRFVTLNGTEINEQDLLMIDPKANKKKGKFFNFLEKVGSVSSDALGMMDANYKKELEQQKANEEIDKVRGFLLSHPEILSATTDEEYKSNTTKTAAKCLKYLVDNKIANLLIAKWFNAKENMENGSHYDMSLIQKRGLYDATQLDVMHALEATRKWAILEDAGMDLISHTFISFTEFEIIDYKSYLERNKKVEDWSKQVHESRYGTSSSSSSIFGEKFANSLSKLGKLADNAFFDGRYKEISEQADQDRLNEATGFYITSTSYLFQLEWDKETEENFIRNYWDASLDKLLQSNEFNIKYLGYKRNTISTTQGTYNFGTEMKHAIVDAVMGAIIGKKNVKKARLAQTEKDQKEKNLRLTNQSLVRSIDQTFSDLQKEYEAFKVKTPIADVSEKIATAFIGMKEGVSDKTKFEVLEKVFNEKKRHV